MGNESAVTSYLKLWTKAAPSVAILRAVGTAAFLAAGVALPIMTIVFGAFVNDFNDWGLGRSTPDRFKDAVNKNALYLVYIFIARFAVLYLGSLIYNVTASRIARQVRLGYVETVMHQPISYFDCRSAAYISTDLTSDVNQLELGLGEKSGVVFQATSMLLASFAIALSKNWKLSLACMTAVPWAFMVVTPLAGIDTKIEAKLKAIYSEASTLVEEALGSIANITALGAADKIVAHFEIYVKKAMRSSWIRGLIWATIVGNVFASMHAVYALCLFYGVKLVIAGEIPDGGTVLIVMFCCILASQSFGMAAPIIPDLIRAGVSAQRVLALIERGESESSSGSNGVSVSDEKPLMSTELLPLSVVGCIELRDVSFAYPSRPSVPVLENVSLDIPAGKITAIVGTSGSGKSTLVALLERWYAVQQGTIALDGTDMEQYSASSWRNALGLVQQEPMLFNDTIAQNILNGYHGGSCDGLSGEDKHRLIVEAATKADAHNFIARLPDGYSTRVGDRGDQLSGGQKQRIALARAIVSNPKILLLDEITSSLDPEAEEAVQGAINAASQNRTTLQISHSLPTVRHADHIAVMDKGHIVEEGTHHGLMQLDGLYARLVRAQHVLARTKPVPATTLETDNARPASSPIPASTNVVTPSRAGKPSALTSAASNAELSLHSESITHRHGLLFNLARLLSTYRKAVLPTSAGLLGAVGIAASFPLTAFLYSKLITVFQLRDSPSSFSSTANHYALLFFILAVAEMALYWLVYYLFGTVAVIAARGYRPDSLRAILKQDSAFFQIPGHASGALMTLLAVDADNVENLLGGSIPIISYHVLNILGCIVMSCVVYWKLGLVSTLICLPLYVVTGAWRMRMDNTAGARCQRFFLESARFVGEAVEAVRTVQALGLEERVVSGYGERLEKAVLRSEKAAVGYFGVYALMESADLLVIAFMFWYGGKLLADGELSVGDYFIIYMAAVFGGQAAGFAFGYFADVGKAKMALNRFFYLMDSRPTINSTTGGDTGSHSAITDEETAIEFQNVSFCYPSRPEVPILQNFNLAVKRGENVCLVGRSGCGKSTVLSLLERFYDVTSGKALIDGQPLTSLDINKYRQRLALVGQETVLYQGTIRDNLILGVADSPSVSDEQITAACREANIHDFIASLPDGYLTECGPRGTALSGGQRQRIAIARALLREPEVLLLDEATSALDTESEELVRKALERAAQGRTIVAAAHHTGTMKAADRVVLIERGGVVEEGTYVDLIQRRGPFWQFLSDEVTLLSGDQ